MIKNALRWGLIALMLLSLCLLLSSPSLAEVQPIDLDMKAHGHPAREDGWISKTEYLDESIHVVYETAQRKPKSSAEKITVRWMTITIADASQLRTTMSNESYDDPTLVRATPMAKSVNAIVACNADFMKYRYDVGYVIRQGVFYRDACDGSRDVLVIDDQGDFSCVMNATSEMMADHLAALASEGRTAINTFSFGPLLVKDGVQIEEHTDIGESRLATQRIAIIQLDHLKYAIMEVDGGNGNGMNPMELGAYILQVFPECKLAYNLDGGGSTHLILNGKMVHKTPNSRAISDIIYFASAQMPEE